jgi:hypothetical protein
MGSELNGRGFWDVVHENPMIAFVLGLCLIWSTERVLKSFSGTRKEDTKEENEVD